MKRSFCFSLFLLITASSSAQWIQSINVLPPNPVTGDVVKVAASVDFSSGSCDQKTVFSYQNGNDFYADALHCLGMLTFICNNVDTFILGQLPSGTYTFHLLENAGSGPEPCTPGIVPGTTDSITFSVAEVTGVYEQEDQLLSVFSANQQSLEFRFPERFNGHELSVTIYSIQGSVLKRAKGIAAQLSVDVSKLVPGPYLVQVVDVGAGERKSTFFVKD